MKIKICGLRRVDDARLAVALGATHVGVVRAESSPRCASLEEARAIFDEVGGRAQTVLVCQNVPLAQVIEEARFTGARAVQLYEWSEESVRALEAAGCSVYRAYSLEASAAELPSLTPAPTEGRPAILDAGGGGSGRRFSWSLLGERAPEATFIAGGVGPDNVTELLRHRPYGVDLSSRIESSPGVKDEARMRAFFRAVEDASERKGS